MIQDQLVDYVSSQMKLGVSRDAIKSALVSAGWVAGDVEDTIKKIEGSGLAAAKPAQSGVSPMSTAAKTSEPQMIRVSDLVSNTLSAPVTAANTKSTMSSMNMEKADASKFSGKISGNSFEASPAAASPDSSNSKKGLIVGVVGGIIILGLAGLSWYFYSGNAGLATQVASLTAQSAGVSAQLTALQSQLSSSSAGFATQIATLTAANADLALDLSFYAAPLGGSSSTSAVALPATISGWLLGGGKTSYAVTTPRGAKILIANSTDVKISAQLKPIIGHTIQVVGTYVPGSGALTASSITDLTPASPMATTSTPGAATSTASSTPTP